MKKINQDELYQHLGGFLKSKGIEFKPGPYTHRIQRGCSLLSDVINASQSGLERAKLETEKKLDQLRQVIHEKTAPKPSPNAPAPTSPPAGRKAPTSPGRARKAARRPATKKTRPA